MNGPLADVPNDSFESEAVLPNADCEQRTPRERRRFTVNFAAHPQTKNSPPPLGSGPSSHHPSDRYRPQKNRKSLIVSV